MKKFFLFILLLYSVGVTIAQTNFNKVEPKFRSILV